MWLTENFYLSEDALGVDCSVEGCLNFLNCDFFLIHLIKGRPHDAVGPRSNHMCDFVAVVNNDLEALNDKALLAFEVGCRRKLLDFLHVAGHRLGRYVVCVLHVLLLLCGSLLLLFCGLIGRLVWLLRMRRLIGLIYHICFLFN